MELFYSTDIRKDTVLLKGQEADHCARVLRHKAGDTVFVIDGKGGLYNCTVSSVNLPRKGDAEVECRIVEMSLGVGERSYHLVMAVCPTKNMDRYEWFAEKATELGVDVIVPLVSDHSIRTTVKKERLEALVLSATKQSLKSCLPVVEDAVSVDDFLLRDFGEDSLRLIAHCEDGEKKLISILDEESIKECVEKGIITGGMIPKIEGCLDTVLRGVRRAHIIDGRVPHSIILELFTAKGIGTMILKDKRDRK